MKSFYKKAGLLALIVGLIMAAKLTGLTDSLTFASLQENREAVKEYAASNLAVSAAVFVLIYIAVTALSLPGALVLTLAGAFVFGLKAVILTVSGATAGAMLAFFAARYILGQTVQRKYGERLARFNREFENNGVFYLLMMRLIPVFPFFLINIFAGVTNISVFNFFWTTFFGIMPGSFVYVYAGTQLAEIDSPKDIVSGGMITTFVLLGVLAVLPVIYRKVFRGRTRV